MFNSSSHWRRLINHWPIVMASVFMVMTLLVVGELYITQIRLHKDAENYLVAGSVRRAEEIEYFLQERRMAAMRLATSHTIDAYLANRALGMSLQYGLNANLDFIDAEFAKEFQDSKFHGRPIYRAIAFFDRNGKIISWTGKQEPVPPGPEAALKAAEIIVDGEHRIITATAPVLHQGVRKGSVVTVIDLEVLSALLITNPAEPADHREFLLVDAGRQTVSAEGEPSLSPADAVILSQLPDRKPTATDAMAGLKFKEGFVALRTPVAGQPMSVLTLTSEKTAFREIGSPLRAFYIGALYLGLFAAAIGFERMRHRAIRLQSDIVESNRHRDELESKNAELCAEITRRQSAEAALESKQARIKELAFFDQLTGLPNRAFLIEKANQVLAEAAAGRHQCALLFIDLDNFKTLNDTLGHNMGDLLLSKAARRLADCVSDAELIARFGGDEFVVLLPAAAGRSGEETEQAASALAKDVIRSLSRPYDLGGNVHVCPPSLGIALCGPEPMTFDELLQRADLAMYEAKSGGRNTFRFFAPYMLSAINKRTALEADLRDDLRLQNFELYFQPQIDIAGRLVGAEALIRWPHKQRGHVPPEEFIGIAEKCGLISPIGNWVIEEACRRLKNWSRHSGLADLSLAINISAVQIQDERFVDDLVTILERTGADPSLLKLELTESVLIDCADEVIEKMNDLRARGVRFSLDDFGTGYSSLLYLKKLPIEQLKIDRSFVRDILIDANDAAIAKMIIALGKTLGLDVLAEGVETDGQLRELVAMGCDSCQGYLIGRPVPAAEFERQAMGAMVSSRLLVAGARPGIFARQSS
jgi:diguanylate cyclase (GGDEF)-like protein